MIHLKSVVLIALVPMIIGLFWFRGESKAAVKAYLGGFLGCIIQSLALGIFIQAYAITTINTGVIVGLIGWALAATSSGTAALFEKRPLKPWLIEVGYSLVSFTLMGALHSYRLLQSAGPLDT